MPKYEGVIGATVRVYAKIRIEAEHDASAAVNLAEFADAVRHGAMRPSVDRIEIEWDDCQTVRAVALNQISDNGWMGRELLLGDDALNAIANPSESEAPPCHVTPE